MGKRNTSKFKEYNLRLIKNIAEHKEYLQNHPQESKNYEYVWGKGTGRLGKWMRYIF